MKIRQTMDKYNIGKNIRLYRMQANLTQEQTIAKMQLFGLSISRGSYSQIECGIANIRVEELLALSKIFGVDINSFFEGIDL